jgi:hypothetical protein
LTEFFECSLQIQSWIKRLLEDPLTEILWKNSHLSKTQLETFLIDSLSEIITGKNFKYDEKAKLRLNNVVISRGSFNRTLKQAKNNINKSINTILLLGYLGIFKTPQLQPFLEISNRLNIYIKNYKSLWNKQKTERIENEKIEEIVLIKNELEECLKELFS